MQRARIDNNKWCLCGKCNHKLFKVISLSPDTEIEIKCHACKEINIIDNKRV